MTGSLVPTTSGCALSVDDYSVLTSLYVVHPDKMSKYNSRSPKLPQSMIVMHELQTAPSNYTMRVRITSVRTTSFLSPNWQYAG